MNKEMLRILKELDVDSALKDVAEKGFLPDTREIALAGLHKARIKASNHFSESDIHYSISWLMDHNYDIPKMGIA